MRGVLEQGLTYADLKRIARNSLEYSFLPGASLWAAGPGSALAGACAGANGQAVTPSGGCGRLIAESPRAASEWRLEADFRAFERQVLAGRDGSFIAAIL
jgi:adenosine deaminase